MGTIEELLRRRKELLQEIDAEILKNHTREVTLLFTDIVGSTRFYERMGDIAGRQMVQTHNDLLFPLIESFGGRIIKTIGDSIMASFADPVRAVTCTVEMQKAIRAYNEEPSAANRFQVRMGLHFGRAVVDERDLFGDAVNTAARVESRAQGDEILVSGAVKERVESAGVPIVFLGKGEVKGKEDPLDFYLVNWQDLDEETLRGSWRAREKKEPQAPPADQAAQAAQAAPRTAARGPRVEITAGIDTNRELAALPPQPTRGNPYLNRVMIPHPGMFFGRKALVRRIMSRLSAQSPQSISLVGERRIGKSSLLNHLRSPKARHETLEAPDSCLFLFLDFQQTRALEPGQFFSLVFSELRRQQAGRIALDLPPDDDGMRLLCEAIAAAGLRLAFLFDEFECVTKNEKIRPEFYSFLRSLANAFPVCFITASGHDLKDMCASHAISDSPFFNIFSVQRVGLFQREDAVDLVCGPSEARGIPLAPVSDRILEMGGVHPFFLQVACAAWFEHLETVNRGAEDLRGEPTPRDVIEAFRQEARPHFEFIVENLPPEEREILLTCAGGGNADASEPAVQNLEARGYLLRTGAEPVLFSAEFREFLRRRK